MTDVQFRSPARRGYRCYRRRNIDSRPGKPPAIRWRCRSRVLGRAVIVSKHADVQVIFRRIGLGREGEQRFCFRLFDQFKAGVTSNADSFDRVERLERNDDEWKPGRRLLDRESIVDV